jgi:hypothetical protein
MFIVVLFRLFTIYKRSTKKLPVDRITLVEDSARAR